MSVSDRVFESFFFHASLYYTGGISVRLNIIRHCVRAPTIAAKASAHARVPGAGQGRVKIDLSDAQTMVPQQLLDGSNVDAA